MRMMGLENASKQPPTRSNYVTVHTTDWLPDDESNILVLPTEPPTPARTTWTLLIYLTGPSTGCVGGETAFYPEHGQAKTFESSANKAIEPIVVGLEVGMALLHKHGNDCLLHEGCAVTAGEKWVIRSDLCVKR
jgi:hypothetical protein